MKAVQYVYLAGGDPWWHQVIGPALLAITAIVAAWIAARTANKRQQEQLRHDRELQADQLAYDREQRSRQHTRDAVDEAVKATDHAVRTIATFTALLLTGEDDRNELRAEVGSAETPNESGVARSALEQKLDELHEISQGLYDISIELASQVLRLGLRLGEDHVITRMLRLFAEAFAERHRALEPLYMRPIETDDWPLMRESEEAASQAMGRFFEACRGWLMEEEEPASNAEPRLTN